MNKTVIAAEKGDATAAEEMAVSIRTFLDQQQLSKARQTAASAAKDHPDHPWLVQADRVLNPDRIVTRPARGKGRTREFTWLRRNADAYRGRWVALLGDELITSAETFQDVQRAVRERTLDSPPLVHYVA
ncbi:MAG TPA: DUF5678 domain-containing protein [Thermoanaerobaculia bacterium]|jgi:hypothetical protein